MARPKIPRKSTSIDMTAMCDVAFLLLSFFILTAKPKDSSAVNVATPSSVASKKAPEKDYILISITKDGKVFFSTGDNATDRGRKKDIISSLNSSNNLGLSAGEIDALVKDPYNGGALAQLKQIASLPSEKLNDQVLPGIPVMDSTNNELTKWVRASVDAFAGSPHMYILLKGDNLTKYPAFKNVITAFKKNDQLKFQMVTNPESVPTGTDLYRINLSGKATE